MLIRPNFAMRSLARGGETGTIAVSRLIDGAVLWCGEHAHHGPISALAWSPNGALLASAGHDGLVHIWDAASGDLLSSFVHGEAVQRLRWSAHGTLASAGTVIRLWPLAATVQASAA